MLKATRSWTTFLTSCRNQSIHCVSKACRKQIASWFWTVFVAIIALSLLGPAAASAKLNYTFEGTLKVLLPNGKKQPIPNAQIRVKRRGGTGAGRKHTMSNNHGDFKGTWKFTRDRDGRLPGRKDIRFDVQMRLRNNRLKLRKGGWFKNNWITVATPRGKDGQDFNLNDVTVSKGKARKLAALWWAHMVVLDALDRHHVGLTNRLTVIYPNKFIFKPNANFYLFKVRLTEDRWNASKQGNTETIIHEAMHQWDVNHMKGERNLVCVADAHHKPPEKWGSSRCSGFMEGFAEAIARQLNHRLFQANYYPARHIDSPVPQTMWNLRNGRNVSYKIENLEEAQTTDDGWQNFLTFIMSKHKFERFNKVPNPSCMPKTVPVWELLSALKEEAPRKANFLWGKATFAWFTDILERRVNGFDSWDGKYYQLLGDPSNRLVAIQKQMCRGERHTILIDGTKGAGSTGYTIKVSKSLQQLDSKVDGKDVTIQSNDNVRGNTAYGHVGAGRDGFTVKGKIQSINLENPNAAQVLVDGRKWKSSRQQDTRGPRQFSGTWSTNFGELRLHRVKDFVIGDYANEGIILGRVSGNCLSGVFTNGPRNGIFRFKAQDRGEFVGQWAWHGQKLQGKWNGERTGDAPKQLTNFTRGESTTQSIDNERSIFDGHYSSKFGNVELLARDSFLIGDYGDKGIIAGMWQSNKFVGYFTNKDRTGWFEFTFFSKSGKFRAGTWGWLDSNKSGSWSLTERNGATPSLDNITANAKCF